MCEADPAGSKMICPALNLGQLLTSLDNPPEPVDLYIVMDGVTLLRDQPNLGHFQYFPDPTFFPFTGPGKLKVFDLNLQELELQVSDTVVGLKAVQVLMCMLAFVQSVVHAL